MKRFHKSYITLAFVCAGLIFIASCSKKDYNVIPETPSPANYNREVMLTNMANGYIKPAYSAYTTQVSNLKTSITTFNSSLAVADLQLLRAEWENTLLIWQDVAFLEFGPAGNISLRAQTNVYPVDTSLINSNIASGTYNLQIGTNFVAKGFQAIDYLLNGIASSDAAIATYYTNTPNARTYLLDLVNELEQNAISTNGQWQGSYSTSFIANSASNAQGSAVSDVVNSLNLHYEAYMRKGKIGLPAGVFNGFSMLPMPGHVEALYHNQSLVYVYRSLSSLQNFINGRNYVSNANGEGLDDYLVFVSAQSAGQPMQTVIDNQFSEIQVELGNISDPLSNEVTTNTQGVVDLYQKMQQMVPLLKIEMTNALEVLITYQDNDGD
jgi:predicted lipoprotein